MSLTTDLARLIQAKADLETAIAAKGVTVPAETLLDGYAALVDAIVSGGLAVTDGIIIKSRNASGYALTADFYGTVVQPNQMAYGSATSGAWKALTGIVFKDAVTVVKEYAFRYCVALAITALPDTIQTIEVYGFFGCNKLALTSLPAALTSMGGSAFFCTVDNPDFKVSTIPNGVTVLEAALFARCTGITSMAMPRVAVISGGGATSGAFYNCSGLVTASVGSAGCPVTGIGAYAFTGCSSAGTLTVYTVDGNALANAPYGWTGTLVHTQA